MMDASPACDEMGAGSGRLPGVMPGTELIGSLMVDNALPDGEKKRDDDDGGDQAERFTHQSTSAGSQ